MFPLKSEPFMNIQQPMLFINTHTFHLPVNLRLIRQYFCSKGTRKLYTLKNTTHESPTDTPYIHGYWLDLQMLKKLDAKTALNLQSSLVVQFLRDTIGACIHGHSYLKYLLFICMYLAYIYISFCTGSPTNTDNAQIFIKEHSDDLVEDVITYTKRVKRKIGIYPW